MGTKDDVEKGTVSTTHPAKWNILKANSNCANILLRVCSQIFASHSMHIYSVHPKPGNILRMNLCHIIWYQTQFIFVLPQTIWENRVIYTELSCHWGQSAQPHFVSWDLPFLNMIYCNGVDYSNLTLPCLALCQTTEIPSQMRTSNIWLQGVGYVGTMPPTGPQIGQQTPLIAQPVPGEQTLFNNLNQHPANPSLHPLYLLWV